MQKVFSRSEKKPSKPGKKTAKPGTFALPETLPETPMPPRCSYAVLALRLAWFAHLATLSYGATELSTTNLIATAVTNIGEDEEAPADVSEEARRQTKCFAVKSCKSGSTCEQTRCQACEDKCDNDGTKKLNTRRGRQGRLACDFYRKFCKNHRDEVCKRDENAMDDTAFRKALKDPKRLAKVADWNVCKVTDFSKAVRRHRTSHSRAFSPPLPPFGRCRGSTLQRPII